MLSGALGTFDSLAPSPISAVKAGSTKLEVRLSVRGGDRNEVLAAGAPRWGLVFSLDLVNTGAAEARVYFPSGHHSGERVPVREPAPMAEPSPWRLWGVGTEGSVVLSTAFATLPPDTRVMRNTGPRPAFLEQDWQTLAPGGTIGRLFFVDRGWMRRELRSRGATTPGRALRVQAVLGAALLSEPDFTAYGSRERASTNEKLVAVYAWREQIGRRIVGSSNVLPLYLTADGHIVSSLEPESPAAARVAPDEPEEARRRGDGPPR